MSIGRATPRILTIVLLAMTIGCGIPVLAVAETGGEPTREEIKGAVVISQEQTVGDISSSIQTALRDADNDTVIVSGSKTNASSSLSINIPEGKTLVWEAVFRGSTPDYLLYLNGKGAFEVIEGGAIDAISGGGMALVTRYDNSFIPDITISGGTVKAASASGIFIYGEMGLIGNRTVTVSGGVVINSGNGDNPAINVMVMPYLDSKVDVVVSGEGRVASSGMDGIAIRSFGNVLIQDEAHVNAHIAVRGKSATVSGGMVLGDETAILVEEGIVVSGGLISANDHGIFTFGRSYTAKIQGGRVEARGPGGWAVYAAGNVEVMGGAISTAGDNGAAIYSIGSGSITLVDGIVSGSKTAILSDTSSIFVRGGTVKGGSEVIRVYRGTVTVEGGLVEAADAGGSGIYAGRSVLIKGGTVRANESNGTAISVIGTMARVTIEGGRVEATGTGGKAVLVNNSSGILVSGGEVIGGRNAIYETFSRTSSVTVTGGLVLGFGSKHVTGDDKAVIYMQMGSPVVSPTGRVVAWNKSAGNRLYGLDTTTDLNSLPENGMGWARVEGKSGISHEAGGFFEIDGVSVAEIRTEMMGFDKLKVGQAVEGTLTYTVVGASYSSGIRETDFAPEGLPDWLDITDISVESNALCFSLSGTPTRTSGPFPLVLPEKVSAGSLIGGGLDVFVPVNGEAAIGKVEKGDGWATADVAIEEITSTEVKLKPLAGLLNGQAAEYGISETAPLPPSAFWQDHPEFSGLSPNKEYYAFVRSKENEHYSSGPPKGGLPFRTDKAQLSGSVRIDGDPVYGAAITAVPEGLRSTTFGVSPEQLGALSYQWWRKDPDGEGEIKISDAAKDSYRITKADIGQIIRVEIRAANCTGGVIGSTEEPVEKSMPMGKPVYTEILKAGKILADAGLTGSFMNPHDNIPVPGSLSWDAPMNTVVERGKAYSWSFTAAEEGCFHTVTGSIVLWPAASKRVNAGVYIPPKDRFTDLSNHWAKESIDYVVNSGLLVGTSTTTFDPDAAMTRGMMLTALGRLAGVDVKQYNTNSFADVKGDGIFRPYIEWAFSKGIVQGIGNSQFAADRAITREEIAVILQNYTKVAGYELLANQDVAPFADATRVGSPYKEAVIAMQQAGIMIGQQNNQFNPKSKATRAEASTVLHRVIKLSTASSKGPS